MCVQNAKKTSRINAKFCEQCGHKMNEIVQDRPAEIIVNDTKCPKCQKENQIDAKYCEDCGQDMKAKKEAVKETICPSCNQVNEKNSNFCGYCRKVFNEKVNPTPAPAPISDINTAGGMKICPICTVECEERLNFCPTCIHKFK